MCLAAGLVLAGCSEGDDAFAFLQSPPEPEMVRPNFGADQLPMADGSLILVPPRGFCVDTRKANDTFAVIARCDTLGAPRASFGAPLGLIAVAITPVSGEVDLPVTLAAIIPDRAETVDERTRNGVVLRHVEGGTPDNTDKMHWRGLAQVGPHLLSMTAFSPPDGPLARATGGRLLTTLVSRSARATASVAQ